MHHFVFIGHRSFQPMIVNYLRVAVDSQFLIIALRFEYLFLSTFFPVVRLIKDSKYLSFLSDYCKSILLIAH